MDKSPEAFRTISEVAETLDVPPHVLRFWETRFAQVKPVKRGGGRRYYRPEDVQLLRGIRGLLYGDGMTIKGVQKILRERGVRHVIGLGNVGIGAVARETETREADAMDRTSEDLEATDDATADAAAPADEPVAEADRAFPSYEPATARAAMLELAEEAAPYDPAPSSAPPRPKDRTALRDLVRQLEALRAVMAADVRS